MREILFRGKDRFSRDWEEGSLLVQKDGCGKQLTYICAERGDRYIYIECDPKTICQYSGMPDREGALIWENDIIAYSMGSTWITGVVKYGIYKNPIGNGNHCGFFIDWKSEEAACFRKELTYWSKAVAVRGNVFDGTIKGWEDGNGPQEEPNDKDLV
ncbi:MAG: YopX family protein [Clostridiales bacterium]|nr:YopX family protein [Clostridiales bacterium]